MFIIFVHYSTRPICDVSMNLFCWPPSVDIFNILPGFLWQPLLSNILILITVALLKGKQSPNGLAHLISFMSWGIWISKDTRVNQKEISASLAISKPCGAEVKLQVKIVITNPLPLVKLLRTLNCLVLWRIHRQNFLLKAQRRQIPLDSNIQ